MLFISSTQTISPIVRTCPRNLESDSHRLAQALRDELKRQNAVHPGIGTLEIQQVAQPCMWVQLNPLRSFGTPDGVEVGPRRSQELEVVADVQRHQESDFLVRRYCIWIDGTYRKKRMDATLSVEQDERRSRDSDPRTLPPVNSDTYLNRQMLFIPGHRRHATPNDESERAHRFLGCVRVERLAQLGKVGLDTFFFIWS